MISINAENNKQTNARYPSKIIIKMAKFITLEGIEGVGKTSNLHFIKELLESSGRSCVVTREPGGTNLGVDQSDASAVSDHMGR